jgi:hypothetical protein
MRAWATNIWRSRAAGLKLKRYTPESLFDTWILPLPYNKVPIKSRPEPKESQLPECRSEEDGQIKTLKIADIEVLVGTVSTMKV